MQVSKCSAVTYGITMVLFQHALKLGRYHANRPTTGLVYSEEIHAPFEDQVVQQVVVTLITTDAVHIVVKAPPGG